MKEQIADEAVSLLFPQAAMIFGRIKPSEVGLTNPFVAKFFLDPSAGGRLIAEIDGCDRQLIWSQATGQWRDL